MLCNRSHLKFLACANAENLLYVVLNLKRERPPRRTYSKTSLPPLFTGESPFYT